LGESLLLTFGSTALRSLVVNAVYKTKQNRQICLKPLVMQSLIVTFELLLALKVTQKDVLYTCQL